MQDEMKKPKDEEYTSLLKKDDMSTEKFEVSDESSESKESNTVGKATFEEEKKGLTAE